LQFAGFADEGLLPGRKLLLTRSPMRWKGCKNAVSVIILEPLAVASPIFQQFRPRSGPWASVTIGVGRAEFHRPDGIGGKLHILGIFLYEFLPHRHATQDGWRQLSCVLRILVQDRVQV